MVSLDTLRFNCYLERMVRVEGFLSEAIGISSQLQRGFLSYMIERLRGLEEGLVLAFKEGKPDEFEEVRKGLGRICELASLIPSKPEIPNELRTFISYYLGGDEGIAILYSGHGRADVHITSEDLGCGLTVLRIPFFDYKSPYMWALLAHDMVHLIERRRGISERVSHSIPVDGELLADLMALLMIGPAYIYALMSRTVLSDPYICIRGHRVLGFAEMGDILKGLGIPFGSDDGASQGCIEVFLPERPSANLDMEAVSFLIDILKGDGIPVYSPEDEDVSRFILFPRMERGELISSYRDPKVEPVVRSMLSSIRDGEGLDIYEVVKMLEERPANPGQIVNAGWRAICKELMADKRPYIEDVPRFLGLFREKILGIGEISRRSIETASIHRLFMRGEG
jgi:hypothetical protein